MRIRVPLVLALLTVVAIGWFAAGCSDDAAPRSILQVTRIHDNQPLSSDVAEGPDSSLTIREDAVAITVSSTPHDAVLDLASGKPFSVITLERYEIRFEGDDSVPPVSGALGWTVESGSTVDGSLVVVPAGHKVRQPLVSLRHGGEIQTIARLTITGREATSGSSVKVETSFPVNFANWTDP